MSITYREPRKVVQALTPSEFKEKGLIMTFLDDGSDVPAPHGLTFFYVVEVEKKERGFWVKPKSSRDIAFSPFAKTPLKGRTFKVRMTGTTIKDTRYIIEEIQKG